MSAEEITGIKYKAQMCGECGVETAFTLLPNDLCYRYCPACGIKSPILGVGPIPTPVEPMSEGELQYRIATTSPTAGLTLTEADLKAIREAPIVPYEPAKVFDGSAILMRLEAILPMLEAQYREWDKRRAGLMLRALNEGNVFEDMDVRSARERLRREYGFEMDYSNCPDGFKRDHTNPPVVREVKY